ncbi:hypothetical protein C8J57DRAFT_1514546 [Mycena rebaudengoi]|nr:hypothetical protein C8J57DRAFT_1514546 [Mycena rebaudengoi]
MSFSTDIVLGALLVGTWANSALYTIEIIQALYFYRNFKHDNWMLKLLVSSTIAIDSVSMIANYASVYLYTITHWGDLAYLLNQYWASHWGPIGSNVVERVLSNSFSSSTSLRLAQWPLWSKVSWLPGTGCCATKNKFITFTLFSFITVAAGGAFACGVTIAMFPEYTNREKVVIPALIWLITEAVADISIASALLWEFRNAKSSFKETQRRACDLLKRLVAQTIQTGTAGASVALAVLVAFLANKESNVPTGIAYTLGRVYCITMLANLNGRPIRRPWSGRGTSLGANLETRGERGNQEQSEGGGEYGGIHVLRTAVVHIDSPQQLSMGSFKTNPDQGLRDDNPAGEIEMTVNDSSSYYSKKKQDSYLDI